MERVKNWGWLTVPVSVPLAVMALKTPDWQTALLWALGLAVCVGIGAFLAQKSSVAKVQMRDQEREALQSVGEQFAGLLERQQEQRDQLDTLRQILLDAFTQRSKDFEKITDMLENEFETQFIQRRETKELLEQLSQITVRNQQETSDNLKGIENQFAKLSRSNQKWQEDFQTQCEEILRDSAKNVEKLMAEYDSFRKAMTKMQEEYRQITEKDWKELERLMKEPA